MPELCEIAITAQYLTSKLRNKFIVGIEIMSGRYQRHELPGKSLIENNILKINKVDSKGKFMWFELEKTDNANNKVYILNNFGLTGMWSFEEEKNARIKFTVVKNKDDSKNKEKHSYLYFTDDRNFGIVSITDKKDDLDEKLNKLAPDLLKTEFTEKDYLKWFTEFRDAKKSIQEKPIVVFLMNQDKKDSIGSGIGNYLSVEILYRAKISPHRQVKSLSDKEILKLAKELRKVIKQCYINNKTGYMTIYEEYADEHLELIEKGELPNYHSDIEINKDKGFSFKVYRLKEDSKKNKVIVDEIIPGRSTYWVPAVQK